MDHLTFGKFRSIIYENSGIALAEGKEALVGARVGKRLRALGLSDYRSYLDYLERNEHGEEIVQLLDAISTNVTHFFREAEHFDFVREVVTGWARQGLERMRFWSAACSTGEKPYSLAITVLDALQGCPADIRILATDISTKVLGQARRGIYEADRVKRVSPDLRERHFRRFHDMGEVRYAVGEQVRQAVVFSRLNLATPPFPMRGPMDIVLCRNVMIYFDNKVRSRLLAEAYRLLKPGGYLIVGHAESLTGMMSDFKTVKPSIYIKN